MGLVLSGRLSSGGIDIRNLRYGKTKHVVRNNIKRGVVIVDAGSAKIVNILPG